VPELPSAAVIIIFIKSLLGILLLSTIIIFIIMIIIYCVIILVTQSDLSSLPEPATAQPASAATLSNSTIGSPIVPPVLDEEAKSERLALINHLMQQHRRDHPLSYPISSDLTFNHKRTTTVLVAVI
jgi:zona occludens toxin (predicted ATPase)